MGCQVLVELAHLEPALVRGLALLGPTMDQFALTRLSHVGRLLRDQFVEPPSLVPLQAYDYLSNGPFRTIKTSEAKRIRSCLRPGSKLWGVRCRLRKCE